jgi:hypothetical protein
MEDAINEIAGIISVSPKIDKISITNNDHVTIFWQSEEILLEKKITNLINLLDWCEDNLLPKSESNLTRVIKHFRDID